MSEQNAVHLASADTYINCAIQTSVCPSAVLLEIDCIIGRSIAMLEDEWKIKGIIRKSAVLKTINWIR